MIVENLKEYILNDIVDQLLMNKSILFVSDFFTYESVMKELRIIFEDVPLYGFSFIAFSDNVSEILGASDKFDNVVVYISSQEDKKYLQSVCSKNVFIF